MRGPILSFLVLLFLAGGLTKLWDDYADATHAQELTRKCQIRQER